MLAVEQSMTRSANARQRRKVTPMVMPLHPFKKQPMFGWIDSINEQSEMSANLSTPFPAKELLAEYHPLKPKVDSCTNC